MPKFLSSFFSLTFTWIRITFSFQPSVPSFLMLRISSSKWNWNDYTKHAKSEDSKIFILDLDLVLEFNTNKILKKKKKFTIALLILIQQTTNFILLLDNFKDGWQKRWNYSVSLLDNRVIISAHVSKISQFPSTEWSGIRRRRGRRRKRGTRRSPQFSNR